MFWTFETISYYVALIGLELTKQIRVASNSQQSSCLSLLDAGNSAGMCHDVQQTYCNFNLFFSSGAKNQTQDLIHAKPIFHH